MSDPRTETLLRERLRDLADHARTIPSRDLWHREMTVTTSHQLESDSQHDRGLVETLDDELVAISASPSRPRRTALVAVAAAGLLVGGGLALITEHHAERVDPPADTPASPTSPTTTLQHQTDNGVAAGK